MPSTYSSSYRLRWSSRVHALDRSGANNYQDRLLAQGKIPQPEPDFEQPIDVSTLCKQAGINEMYLIRDSGRVLRIQGDHVVIEYYPEGVAERRVLTLQEIVRFKPLREGDKVDSTVVTVQRMPFAEGLSEEEATEKWEELNEQAQKDIAEEYPGIF